MNDFGKILESSLLEMQVRLEVMVWLVVIR